MQIIRPHIPIHAPGTTTIIRVLIPCPSVVIYAGTNRARTPIPSYTSNSADCPGGVEGRVRVVDDDRRVRVRGHERRLRGGGEEGVPAGDVGGEGGRVGRVVLKFVQPRVRSTGGTLRRRKLRAPRLGCC
ncbi:hypothetical protein MRB53_041895 [Persea americana]|nr:hypothetical protein MRB53_041895 [Persea americana]